ncbi:MAG TPA: O-antigen ligase family protein [Stellaceae bacterium]|nr:O-antigen ligase family protein [Stellaceae bacterium]
MAAWAHRSCLCGVLALALWAPLPFGSARPWAAGLLAIVGGVIVMSRGVADLGFGEEAPGDMRELTLPALLFALALGWAMVQSLPLAPSGWQHPLWAEAQSLLAVPPAGRIGIDPSAARNALVHLISDAAIFWLAFRAAQRPEGARTIVVAVAVIGALYAGWGLIVYGLGNRSVLWFDKWAYPDDLTSTFVNRNSFATFAGLALVTSVGLLVDAMLARIDFQQDRRLVLSSLFDLVMGRAAWLVAAITLALTAVLLTHSRGGAIATGAGIVGLIVTTFLAPSLRGPWRGGFAVMAVAAALLLVVISGATTLGRIADTAWDAEGRREIYELTLEAIGNTPLLGTGLGTFKWIFPTYRTEDMPFTIELAHNDYLENMLELGIPATLLLTGAAASLSFACIRGVFRRRRNAIIPCIGVGASLLVGVHACFDFSLQIPAVSLLYLLLLGAGVAQSSPTRIQTGEALT